MRRLAAAAVLVLGFVFLGAGHSRADVTSTNGSCFASPYNTLAPCTGTVAPAATPRLVATPTKSLSVSPGQPGAANTTGYNVTITSVLSCFALNENTLLYTLGSPGAAAISELLPNPGEAAGNPVSVRVDQTPDTIGSGTAQLSLEVSNAAIGPAGLTLKAVWPQEKLERIVPVVAPAAPTSTATPVPNTTATQTPTATPTPTATASPTATSSPNATGTVTATATPAPTTPSTAPFTVLACVQPPILNGATRGGEHATLNGLAVPGATCIASILYLDGLPPVSFDGTARLADAEGLVAFPLAENTTAGGGIAQVQCTLGTQIQSSCTGFLVLQTSDNSLTDQDQQKLLAQIQSIVDTPSKCSRFFPT